MGGRFWECQENKKNPQTLVYQEFGDLAEKEGFEPSRPFRGLHDFQSCALDQLGDFSIAVKHSMRIHLYLLFRDSVIIIAEEKIKSSLIFTFSAENAGRWSTALFFMLFQQALDGFIHDPPSLIFCLHDIMPVFP